MQNNLLVFDSNTLTCNGITQILNKSNQALTIIKKFKDLKENMMGQPFTHILIHIDENINAIIDLFHEKKMSFSGLPIMFYSHNTARKQKFLINIPNSFYMDSHGSQDYLNTSILNFLNQDAYLNNFISNPFEKLTSRQLEIIAEINKGKKVTEVANLLHLKANTISTVKANVFKKLNINSIRALTLLALKYKI